MTKTTVLGVRLTQEELGRIDKEAGELGMTRVAYAKSRILAEKISGDSEVEAVLAERTDQASVLSFVKPARGPLPLLVNGEPRQKRHHPTCKCDICTTKA